MNSIFSSSILPLSNQAEQSCRLTEQQLNSYRGLTAIWLGNVPIWAKDHIIVTKRLEREVHNLKLQGKGETISPQIDQTLTKSLWLVHQLAQKIDQSQFLACLETVAKEQSYADETKLLSYPTPQSGHLPSFRMEWHINLGLMMHLYERTKNPILKKEISFLVLNYLAKAAPINFDSIFDTNIRDILRSVD